MNDSVFESLRLELGAQTGEIVTIGADRDVSAARAQRRQLSRHVSRDIRPRIAAGSGFLQHCEAGSETCAAAGLAAFLAANASWRFAPIELTENSMATRRMAAMAGLMVVIWLPEQVESAGSARALSVVHSHPSQARFIVEQRERDLFRSMRREGFRGKALHAAEQ
jgi:hypothetical protein